MLPSFGELAKPSGFRDLTKTAERNDFDAVWVGDHISFPDHIPDTYPFSPSGESPFDVSQDAFDAFNLLSHLAGVTESIQLGTNTCIVPYRHPVVLARNALTVEALSDGRFDFGVAPGWMETEFEVLDVPFEERGSRTDEFLEIFTRACVEGEFEYGGPHHSFQKTGFHPRPKEGNPPIWVGGRSGAAFRRVAEYGDGWTIFWDKPEEIASARQRILNAWNDFDRGGEPEIAVVRAIDLDSETDRDTSRPLIGSAEEVAADLEAYQEAGATRVILDFFDRDLDDQKQTITQFSDSVMPLI